MSTKKTASRKKNKTSFKKGHTKSKGKSGKKGNTNVPTIDQRAVIKIDKNIVEKYFNLNSGLTPHQIVARLKTLKITMLEAIVMRAMLKAYRGGEAYQCDFVLNRMIGKVPNKIHHEVINPYDAMTIEQLEAEKARLNVVNRNEMTYQERTNPNFQNLEREVTAFVKDPKNTPDGDK